MVKPHPHTLILSVVASSTQDSEGNWQNGSTPTSEIECRFETNSGSRFIKGADGTQVVYDGIVYASVSTPDIDLGTAVEVKNGDTTIAKGMVKQFSRGQLNVRIWL